MTKLSILVVDDNPESRVRLATELGDEYDVVACASGAEAIESARRRPGGFRFAVVDYRLENGGLDGLQTTHELAALSQGTFILLYSNVLADVPEQANERLYRAYDAGAHRFLQRKRDEAYLQVKRFIAEMNQLREMSKRVADFYENRRHIPSVLGHLKLGVDIVDQRHKVWFVNDEFRRITGTDGDTLLRRPCFDWHGYQIGPCPGCLVCQAWDNKAPEDGRIFLSPFPGRGQDLHYVQVWTMPVTDEQGNVICDEQERPLAIMETVKDLTGSDQLRRMSLEERLGYVAIAIHERLRPGFRRTQPFERVAIYAIDPATIDTLRLVATSGYGVPTTTVDAIFDPASVPDYERVLDEARHRNLGTCTAESQPDPLRTAGFVDTWIYWPILGSAGTPVAFLRLGGRGLVESDLDTLAAYAEEVARTVLEQQHQQERVGVDVYAQTRQLAQIERQIQQKAGSPREVLRLLVSKACELTGCYGGHIRERQGSEAVLLSLAPHPYDEYERQAQPNWPLTNLSSWTARTMVSCTEQLVNDVQASHSDIARDRSELPNGAKAVVDRALSMCFLPLVFQNQCIGALGLHHERQGAFSEETLWLLRRLARRAAMALHDLRAQREHEEQRRYLGVLNEVTRLLVDRELDMQAIVEGTAKALVEVGGYYRTLLCLVNGRRTRIQAVASFCAEHDMDFRANDGFHTDFALQNPERDIQPWVVSTRQPCLLRVTPDTQQTSPALQVEQAKALGMQTICVLPLRYGSEVIGTLHVERMDRGSVGKHELNQLQSIADHVAVVFKQAERVTLMARSLCSLENRFRLIDPRENVLFLNRKRGEMEAGWQRNPPRCQDTCVFSETDHCKFCRPMWQPGSALDHARHYIQVEEAGQTKAYDWELTRIRDFRAHLAPPFSGADPVIGFVERSLDLTGVYEMSARLREWLGHPGVGPTATEILRYIRKDLHFRWCRIYLVGQNDHGNQLQSLAEFGLRDTENQKYFREGHMRFPQRGDDPQPWYVIDHSIDLAIFRLDKAAPARSVVETRPVQDVRCFKVADFQYQHELEKSDRRWLEIPLLVGPEKIGKLSLSLKGKMRGKGRMLPADFELLKMQALGIAVALHQAMQAEKRVHFEEEKREHWRRVSYEIAHQIKSPLSALAVFLRAIGEELDLPENDQSRVSEHLAMARKAAARLERLMDCVMELAENTLPTLVPCDLAGCVTDAWQGILMAEPAATSVAFEVAVHCDGDAKADRTLVLGILDVLMKNSVLYGKPADGSEREIACTVVGHPSDQWDPFPDFGGPHVSIILSDNGKGVPDKILRTMAEPFKAHATGRGAGLGLAIACRKATAMGARLAYSPECPYRKCGATFAIGFQTSV